MKEYFQEKQILAKINQGDEASFLEVYNYYAPKLFRHACYRLSSREQAEDISQQVFYKTWQYIIKPENRVENLNAFLYKTINNLITDYYRKPGENSLSLGDVSSEVEEKFFSESTNIDSIDQDLEKIKVKEAMRLLKPDQQQYITWRYLDDLSITEIAKISGKSTGAVYVAIHRALKDLKKVII